MLGCAWRWWRRRDHEPTAICASDDGLVRNGRSRRLGRRLAYWRRFGRHRERRRSVNRGPPSPSLTAEVVDAPQATASGNIAVASANVAAVAELVTGTA